MGERRGLYCSLSNMHMVPEVGHVGAMGVVKMQSKGGSRVNRLKLRSGG